MTNKDYNSWDKSRLIEEIRRLSNRKKYGLVWEEKPEEVVEQCKTALPVLEEVEDRAIEVDSSLPINFIIEGDNFHALSVLNYTHAGKVDVIYIDPPFNTGAKDWKYNNHYVDSSDSFKHSKWLSFMEHRLCLSKSLMKDSGVIIVAIDHYELFYLGQLLDTLFGESNRLGCVTVVNKADGRSDDKYFATSNEFLLVYAKNSRLATISNLDLSDDELRKKYPKEDEQGRYVEKPMMSQGVDSLRKDRPSLFYPAYYNPKIDKLHTEPFSGSIEILPVDVNGVERRWGSGKKRMQDLIDSGEIIVKKSARNKAYFLYRKKRADIGTKPKTFWNDVRYNAAAHGTKLLDKIIGKTRIFNYPKALFAVMDALQISGSKNALILDFFAGSGTTGHAVLALNRKDGGGRKFILATNNENGIAENVTHTRIKNVINGYADVEGIPANIRYFKTAFVPKSDVSDDTRRSLITKSTEMLCVKESTFKKIFDNKKFKIYRDAEHATAILFDLDAVDEFKERIENVGLPTNIYVFSLTSDNFAEDFVDLKMKHYIRPIPEGILEVYRKIFA